MLLGTTARLVALDGLQLSDPPDSHRLVIDTADKGYWNYPVRMLDRSTVEAMTFDPARDEPASIRYHLTRDGTIRIRVVWRGDESLVLRTLLDWEHQEFGDHQVRWDGRDASGNLVDNKGCRITFEGDEPVHLQHDRADCHEPGLEILDPPAGSTITDLSEIRARVQNSTASGREYGYSLRCYVDYELVHEQPLDRGVEVFALPSGLPLENGKHLVTLNLDDGADHVGVAGVRVNASASGPLHEAGGPLFRKKGCDLCHELTHPRWVEPGPGLQFIGSRRPADYLRRVIVDPRSVNQTAKMPAEPLGDDELELLLDYLVSMQGPPAATPRPGGEIYAEEGCADCHETEGEFGAMRGPELRGVGHLRSRPYLERAVVEPRQIWPRTSMPPTRLGSQELQNLVDFLVEK